MGKKIFITTILAIAFLVSSTAAEVSIVMNGSFEADDRTIDVIEDYPPRYWCDINLPEGNFGGSVWEDWSSHGRYYLNIYSDEFGMSFKAGDIATVSQQVYLEDVNEIIFDLYLDTEWNEDWDPQLRSAVLLIDDEVVWESNNVGTDVRGVYLDQSYAVEQKYKDASMHKLSLGIRVNQDELYPLTTYYAMWDFVNFNTHCGGFGYLPGDLSGPSDKRDCYVDNFDLTKMAQLWLQNEPNELYDLFPDDNAIINFPDYSVFAQYWMLDSDWWNWPSDNCYQVPSLDADLNNDGIVNLYDFAILAGRWQSDVTCDRADIVRNETVDEIDLSAMFDKWLQKSWMYGL
ncbi:MAG: hypothetical protein JXB29_03340 [Sedimentisphaerales bacterium]|nr:hypothetical protein [Sedimentisphaerales bacterium]